MKVFFDTSAFIALFNKKDPAHNKVLKKYNDYKKTRAIFLTSDYVLDELYTRLIYDYGKKLCQEVIGKLTLAEGAGEIGIISILPVYFGKAKTVLLKFSDHRLSFTDATIYVIAKELKVNEIFTLDSDFKKVGLASSF